MESVNNIIGNAKEFLASEKGKKYMTWFAYAIGICLLAYGGWKLYKTKQAEKKTVKI